MQYFSVKSFCEFSISTYQDTRAGKRSQVIKYIETSPEVLLIIKKRNLPKKQAVQETPNL